MPLFACDVVHGCAAVGYEWLETEWCCRDGQLWNAIAIYSRMSNQGLVPVMSSHCIPPGPLAYIIVRISW